MHGKTYALFILNPDEYNRGLHYYPFMVNLVRFNGSCNTHDDPSGKICVPNRAEDASVFNMITINESRTLKKHIRQV